MKRLNQLVVLAGVAFLCLSTGQLAAQQRQGRGNFDPAQFQQQREERYREQFEVKNDEEWKLIWERIQKVDEARQSLATLSGRGGFGRGAARRGGDGNAQGDNNQGGGRRGRGGFGNFEPAPELEALQKALESKASNDELKTKLAKLRDARKDKQAKLDTAQSELRKVLSVRQEAVAVSAGLLQ